MYKQKKSNGMEKGSPGYAEKQAFSELTDSPVCDAGRTKKTSCIW